MPFNVARRELAIATATKGKNERIVFGSGLVSMRGMTTKTIKIINGYIDRGRTRVPPPIFSGKNGKLVTGRVTRKTTHRTLVKLLKYLRPFFDHLLSIIDTLYV
jgi:hypothetical protein